ncbi:MAG: hypothetical protein HQ475_07265 [SAR202 cluster bacterium]|nr:hypothetical protein [SAR202 cluster bacterium]
MPKKPKSYNDLELETIAALRAEGHDSFTEMTGPLRRRMAEKTGKLTRPTPWLIRFAVATVGLLAVGLLFLIEYAK